MSTPTHSLPKDKVYNIGHVMPYPGIGGTELATLRMAKLTESNEIRNHFLIPESYAKVAELFVNNGFPVHEIDLIEPSIRHFRRYYNESKKLAVKINHIGLDLIHASDMGAAFSVSLAVKLAKLPLISHVRSLVDEITSRDKLFLFFVDHWIFVSKASRDGFAFKSCLPKASVLYDSVKSPVLSKPEKELIKCSLRDEFDLPNDVKLAGMVSRISPQKDHRTLIDAVTRLKDIKELKVMIIGNTDNDVEKEYLSELKKYIDTSGTTDRFIFTGFRDDIGRLMTALDVHVLSTHLEGFPLVNLEAMSKRTPVISTAISGVPEAINDGENGFLVEHENAEQLADRMKILLEDKVLAAKMGDDAYEFVKENFSSERFRDQILAIYSKMLKK